MWWIWTCCVALATGPADGYRTWDQVYGEVQDAAAHAPVQHEIIGRSAANLPIHAWHVEDRSAPIERRVLIFAGIHALEWISTEVATELLLELMAAPPPGISVTVVPLLNPDGRMRVEGDVARGDNFYRRGNHNNKDLNRDFAHQREARAVWKDVLPGYYATTADTPLSQPESQAIDALAARGYDRAASLHAFGGYLYHAWAGHWRRPDNHADILALGRQMESAQRSHAYRTRQLSRWGFFFRAHGTEVDHLYGEYGIDAFLIELTRSGWDPRSPLRSLRTYFRWYNPARPARHTTRGVQALRALIHAEPSETD